MSASIVRNVPSAAFLALAVAAVLHALLVALLWVGEFYFDISIVPARAWLVLAWAWLIWPVVLLLHPDRSLSRVLIPCFIGVALLGPCLSTIWSVTAWAIVGFAP
jgi:hypothetical protein